VEGHEFGWDNEHPKREVDIGRFKIEWRPVTNGEFYQFYTGVGRDKASFPASWVDDGGIIKVCVFSIKLTCPTTPCFRYVLYMVLFHWK
jgi:formylglycine-generating enzyme required for sulfatase activity